jgi:ATP-binding cassette, subfamily B, bacterial MsbA
MRDQDPLQPARLSRGDPFWAFARALLRERWAVTASFVLAVLSAFLLGVGAIGAKPVLDNILGSHQDLPTLARMFNEKLPQALVWLKLPEAWIGAMPAGDPFAALVWIMVGLAVLTVIGAVATFGHAYLSLTIVNRTITAVRHRAFRSVLRAPLRTIVTNGPTDYVSRIASDSTQLANGLNVLLSKTIIQGAKGVAGFVAAFWYDWRVAGVALLVTPGLYTIIRRLGKRIRKASGAALEGQSQLLSVATEGLQGLRVVKAHDAEGYEGGRFHRVNKRVFAELNRVRTARAVASPLTESLTLILLCAMVLLAAKQIIAGRVEPTNFIMAVVMLAVAGAALKPLTALAHDIQTSTPAADRLRELICLAPEPGRDRTLPALARHAESVTFERVSVTYPGRDVPALREASLSIRHGQRVALVGPNGSGKTTLLSLVNRMFDPNDGRVLVDGVDIKTVRVRSLRAQVGVVTQETVLFRGTIRQNIAYGSWGASQEKIVAAAMQARAHEFISRLPLGYETPVAEQGLSLSGGQRQRIAIARAILRDPAILLLDEATSMVDSESEAQIAQALAEFSTGRTCLIVAHRLSTVVRCDAIAVFDTGRIVDIGRHDELLLRCGVYQQMAKHQLIGET